MTTTSGSRVSQGSGPLETAHDKHGVKNVASECTLASLSCSCGRVQETSTECLVRLNALLRELSVRICAQRLRFMRSSGVKSDSELRAMVCSLRFFAEPQFELRGRLFRFGLRPSGELLDPHAEGMRLAIIDLAQVSPGQNESRHPPIICNGSLSRERLKSLEEISGIGQFLVLFVLIMAVGAAAMFPVDPDALQRTIAQPLPFCPSDVQYYKLLYATWAHLMESEER
eukprot:RCo034445